MLASLQCVVHNTTHAFLNSPGCLPPPFPRHSCLQLFSASPGEKGRGCPSRIVQPSLAQRAWGSPRIRNAEPPPYPRRTPLFVYPAAQLAVPRPEVAWGPARARRKGERRRVPAGGPTPGLLEAGRQS